jgi:hypothetical protein
MHISANDLHCCKPARMLQLAPSGGRPRRRPLATAPPRRTPTHRPTSPTTTDCAGRLMAGRQQTAPPQQRRSKDCQRRHSPSTPARGPPRPPTPRPSPQPTPTSSQSQGQVPITEQDLSLVLGPLNSLLWYVPSSRYIWSSAPTLFLQEQIKDIIISNTLSKVSDLVYFSYKVYYSWFGHKSFTQRAYTCRNTVTSC